MPLNRGAQWGTQSMGWYRILGRVGEGCSQKSREEQMGLEALWLQKAAGVCTSGKGGDGHLDAYVCKLGAHEERTNNKQGTCFLHLSIH